VLRPAGFDGRLGTAMLGAFAAKELFVAQLGIVFAVDAAEGDPAALRARLRAAYSPLRGLCVMLFCLIGLPCMATVAATRKETGSWGWSAFQFAALTVLGWLVAVAVFQAGRLLGLD
jgi:ferrous iron transport protein B